MEVNIHHLYLSMAFTNFLQTRTQHNKNRARERTCVNNFMDFPNSGCTRGSKISEADSLSSVGFEPIYSSGNKEPGN